MCKAYLLLAIAGLALPYYFFLSFLLENGPDLVLLADQPFANDISTFFAIDLIITAIVFLVYSYRETQRSNMGSWWRYVIATLVVGPSFAFPLFLLVREGAYEQRSQV